MRQGQAGFSLVELLFAIMILGVGIAGMARGVTASLSSSKESEIQTKAALFASSKLELLRAEGFLIEGQETGECGPALPGHGWTQKLKEVEPEGLYEVTVILSPTNATDRTTFKLETLLFDPPIGLDSSTDRENARKEERQSQRQENRPQ